MCRKLCKWTALISVLFLSTVIYGGHIEHHGCEPCHTPHHSPADSGGVPLWSGNATTTTFTLYSSATLAATPEQPTGSSKLCLSCHDGTDPYIGRMVDGHTVPSNFGDDLSRSHPISFDYSVTYAAKPTQYQDPSAIPAGYLPNGRVECSSCHNVHDNEGMGEAALRGYGWEDAPHGGDLCLVCHLKG